MHFADDIRWQRIAQVDGPYFKVRGIIIAQQIAIGGRAYVKVRLRVRVLMIKRGPVIDIQVIHFPVQRIYIAAGLKPVGDLCAPYAVSSHYGQVNATITKAVGKPTEELWLA